MFSTFAISAVIFLLIQGTVGFFVKHVKTGMCIYDTEILQGVPEPWGNVTFVELSNDCFNPAAQFQFRDNGAILSLNRPGCLFPIHKYGSGYYLDMFYLYVNPKGLDTEACRGRVDGTRNPAITQTSWGGLSVKYTRDLTRTPQTMCAVPKKDRRLVVDPGIDFYIGLTTDCHDAENKRFNIGSVTCHGDMVKNANCPKDQYMVVKTASYRGLSHTKTCRLSDDYSCKVDTRCLLKKQCDGQHECNITVDNNLFSDDLCPGLTKYLYFEYQCTDTSQTFDSVCVNDVLLSNSTLPNEGFVQIVTELNGNLSVCWQTLKNNADDVICRQVGYTTVTSHFNKPVTSGSTDKIFSGSIDCNGEEQDLSQCSITNSNQTCSELSYIKCSICPRPLLEDKQRFPDSAFTASASSGGHSASDARISSGSSWCAPVSDGKHYLEVDFGRLYFIDHVATFGDSTSVKYVTTYNLYYTVDLEDSIHWKSVSSQMISGNNNSYNDAAIRQFQGGITTKALRFIPLEHVGEPCMRIEICGVTLLPDQPTNLTVTNIRSTIAEITWIDPVNTGDGGLTRFRIILKKDNSLIQRISTNKHNEWLLNGLVPNTKYEISVAAGNKHGFGEETITSFLASEAAPEGPPLNVTITAESSSSLSVTWEPPEEDKRNGEIVKHIVCISHEENKPCFEEYTTKEKMIVIENLNASTKYYVRVLASTKVGPGFYSESEGKFTNGKNLSGATTKTETTLTFQLQIPSRNFVYFYVVALKLKDEDDKPLSPDSYKKNDLVTYNEARKSTTPQPYIAAVVTSENETTFILGDGRNTSNPTSRRRRSTSSDYYNGPLEPATSYSIFQRIFINEEGEFYSTDWSPASSTASPKTTPKTAGRGAEVCENNFVGIIVLAILVVILSAIVAYLIYKIRRALKKPGERDDDDHVYSHLHEVEKDYVNQEETRI